jgi:hypothetical protein
MLMTSQAGQALLNASRAAAVSSDASDVVMRSETVGLFAMWLQTSRWLRQAGALVGVSNEHEFGLLMDASDYDHDKLFPDMYMLENNRNLWREKYLSPEYSATVPKLAVDSYDETRMCWGKQA